MRSNYLKTLKTAVLAVTVLLLGASVSLAQQQVNLTAGPTSITLPNGASVPMWGYSCGAVVADSTATCAMLNPAATGWSPVVITVPTTATGGLAINLTNNLTFGGNPIPTSLVIVGQLGGGLGTAATTTPSPTHPTQTLTWPASGADATNTPPTQGPRVQSFSTEVAAGTTTLLPAWANLRPGTYLIESGTHPSIQGPMGLYGILVVTTAPAGAAAGTAYPGVSYNADIPLLLSEIDPVQNKAVDTAVNTVGFSETAVWSGQEGGCGVPTTHTCYPPAVNYTPVYYLFNGVAFDKTNASASLFPASPTTGVSGSVLVRLVNAGLRMHVPSIVGAQTGGTTTPVSGFQLIAEDGNPLPGTPRVQSEVFMAAGKTYDVLINAPPAAVLPDVAQPVPIYDRSLGLSGNATARDAGMLAYIGINGAGTPSAPVLAAAAANPDTYNSVISGQTLTVSDPAKGVIANDVNISGVSVVAASVTGGTLTLNTNGTFTFAASAASGSFQYCGNGATSGPACTTVTLGTAPIEAASGISVGNKTYTSNTATALSIKPAGVLSTTWDSCTPTVANPCHDRDAAGYPLTVAMSTGNAPVASTGLALTMDPNGDGGFSASVAAPGTYSFTYKAQNSQGTMSSSTATVTLIFPTGNGPQVTVVDGKTKVALSPQDYRWIIEEDRTFYINPNTTTNTGTTVPTFGTNFHTSYMPVVAEGCTGTISCEDGQTFLDTGTGTHVPAVCDLGNGSCRTGSTKAAVLPSQVVLDPTKRYYISVLPGDAIGVDSSGQDLSSSHAMGGAPIAAGQTSVTVIVEPTPLPTAKVSVFVFEDDFPTNGEHDAGGGVDVLAPNEPGLGAFNITLFDDVGGTGDAAGQLTYDMFNMPLGNALAGTIDPSTGLDACPVSANARKGFDGVDSPTGLTGVIPVCPNYEADGVHLSPLAGQAVIANLPPGRYGVVATPGADRITNGEEWLQTNTLDGGKAHDSFIKVSEPGYFQEYGPAGYHVAIGFANPAIINGRKQGVCTGATNCNSTVTGKVTAVHMSRTPDERLYSSGTRDTFGYTQCFASLGSPDGADFTFVKCEDDGTFTFTGIPSGDWRVTIFDQWNDQIVDGISTPVRAVGNSTVNMGDVAVHAWKTNLYTRTFFDTNGDGRSQDDEPGLSLVPTNIRFRDGSFSNFNSADLDGFAGFNEVFPLFNWYVVETDSTRYKNTGTHVVYDAGGPVDGSSSCGAAGYPPCGPTPHAISTNYANTSEQVPLPTSPSNLRVPGAVYCSNADCSGFSIAAPPVGGGPGGSTGRLDPPWVTSYGWQGFIGQNSFLEFGKKPFAAGENGGIKGHVVYASTRPFDDPALLLQLSWEPQVPNVTINLYQEGTAPDGSKSLTLVDTTKTSSWDDWAQGFRSDGVPNMNCPGQSSADLFIYTLAGQPFWLNPGTLPNNSQFKCFDGLHNFNQLQPAPYDGMYQFPSIAGRNPSTGAPTGGTGSVAGTNCTICGADTDGMPMLPAGKYVVEMVVPPGYELVKEEDKNILLGDSYVAPVTQQFAGAGNIFIMPDQAAVSASYNPNNSLNPTTDLGAQPRHEGDTGSVETFWPCVGAARVVPDYVSLFPASGQNSPFAGATRNLCDRKEVTLEDQMSVLAKFYVFTSTHIAAHFTGLITDDFTAEFDPFSPSFGEKFAPPNLPVSVKDWAGNEVARVYADQWGAYNGLSYSSYGVNPPDPSGYVPTMMVVCMNDAGTGTIPDPLFQPAYSQFCYETPFMPGQTQYMDTPVVANSAFAGAGYNNPDCAYPNTTPAISEVDGDGIGPWISASGTSHPITIHALGDQLVPNNGYSGPSATAAQAPYNAKTITRHYDFGVAQGTVTIGGVTATVMSWSPSTIVVTLPGTGTQVPLCAQQQQAQYGGSNARCGEVVVTAANGKQSIDTVTLTIESKIPTRLTAGQTIQSVIDAAAPGDLIIVPPGTYNELVIMWKPVRLQGVGAASSVINANIHPAGVLDPWRAKMICLFGLALNGQPVTSNTGSNPYDPSGALTCGGWSGYKGEPNNPQVDRMPLEGILGWDANLNGNLAQQLQEPTLLGAYEGAGITVVGRGVKYPAGASFIFGNGPDTGGVATEAQFPLGTNLLTPSDCGSGNNPTGPGSNPYPSNFLCNPSRIDGLSVTNSSQGGGGILVHGWGHNLEISNNRVYNNTGSLSGGITVGIGETPDALLAGNNGDPVGFDQQPWTCVNGAVSGNGTQNASPPGIPDGTQLPFCYDRNVNVHHNAITTNSSIGDNLFSGTPAGAGGVSLCPGADGYKLSGNWICGNLSTGDGGGVVHLGYSENGLIEHNSILFNQSTNPTIPTNGGGLIVMTTAPDGFDATGQECGSVTDVDCPPGLGDGTGPGLVVNANLIMGNAAESGSGGGIRFQGVNGTEVSRFPLIPSRWYSVSVTNNIIANNVAGWDGGGVSLHDSLAVNLINNSILSNDTTASSGVLFNTFRSGQASAPPPAPCTVNCGTESAPQAAGLSATGNSASLIASLPGFILCPAGHSTGLTNPLFPLPILNGSCRRMSFPILYNDLIWQNRAFHISVGALSPQYQQAIVTLTPTLNQPSTGAPTPNGNGQIITGGTGACVTPPAGTYWDIGVRGDTGPTNHSSGYTLTPVSSVVTSGYSGNHNSNSNPTVVSQYCNGSRIPPEFGGSGYLVPPGTNEGNVPVPVFNLTAGATVDEGNNWVNISWGPLALTNPSSGAQLGNYAPAANSPAIDYITLFNSTVSYMAAPAIDFFNNPRKTPGNPVDVGAVEFTGANTSPTLTSIVPNQGGRGTSVPVTLTGTNLAGATAVNVSGSGITVSGIASTATTVTATFAIASNATLSTRNVSVSIGAVTSNTVTFTVVIPPAPTLTSIVPNVGVRGSLVPVTLTGTNFTTTGTTVNVSGSNVTVSAGSLTVVDSSHITATFAIGNTAALTARNVSVTTPGGTSGNVTFTVQGPTLTSIAPNTGVRGSSVPVTLTGTNFPTTGTTTVNVSGSGVTASGVTVVSATQITATFTITAGANLTSRNVTVNTPIGNTNAVTFTVQGATLASIASNTGTRGSSVPVTLAGTNFPTTGTTTVDVSGSGVTASGVTVVNSTTVTANLAITGGAAPTARNVRVVTPIGNTNTVPFTVGNPPAPTLTSVAPNTGLRGSSVPATLTGTNFTTTGTTVSVPGGGVTVSGVTVVNATTITATFTITNGATLGNRNVSVTTPGGTSGTVPFTVQGATLASIAATSGLHNTTVPVTLTGANLTGATVVNVSGGGITVSGVTVVDSTTVTANFAITNYAAHTARNVSVVTPTGTTNTVMFTVN